MEATEAQNTMDGSGGKLETLEHRALDPDIQAIMTVLRRRYRYFGHGEPEQINLRWTDLSGAFLRLANLSLANLAHVKISGASLSGASLYRAELSGALLSTVEDLTQEQLDKAVGDEKTMLPLTSSLPHTGAGRLANRARRIEDTLELLRTP